MRKDKSKSTASKEKWAKAEGAMMLKADYEAASKIHIEGGPNAGILAELVRMGWRKSEANMNPHNQNGGTTPLELALAWGPSSGGSTAASERRACCAWTGHL